MMSDSKETETEENHNDFNPFDCPNAGPVFHEPASEDVCPICRAEDDEHSVDGNGSDDEHREAEEAEVLAALSWESFFDRYG